VLSLAAVCPPPEATDPHPVFVWGLDQQVCEHHSGRHGCFASLSYPSVDNVQAVE